MYFYGGINFTTAKTAVSPTKPIKGNAKYIHEGGRFFLFNLDGSYPLELLAYRLTHGNMNIVFRTKDGFVFIDKTFKAQIFSAESTNKLEYIALGSSPDEKLYCVECILGGYEIVGVDKKIIDELPFPGETAKVVWRYILASALCCIAFFGIKIWTKTVSDRDFVLKNDIARQKLEKTKIDNILTGLDEKEKALTSLVDPTNKTNQLPENNFIATEKILEHFKQNGKTVGIEVRNSVMSLR